jgi:hypothetical protein
MGDISFTEMGQALDAAAQSRESQSVSPDTSTSAPSDGNGGDAGKPEGATSPSSPGDDAQPPKTDEPAVGDGDSQSGNPASPKDKSGTTPDDKEAAERKARNQMFAARRLEQKREKERRQKEKLLQLQKERDELLQKDDERSHLLAEMKRERINEILQQEAEERQQVWQDECYRIFDQPGEAEQFMAMADKYADYIIHKEPTLNSMIGRPYGKLLLKAWMDRIAEDPVRRQEWLGMTEYEKGAVLTHFYGQLEAMGQQNAEQRRNKQPGNQMPPMQNQNPQGKNLGQQVPPQQPIPPDNQGGQQPPQQQTEVPVPGSGRNTSTMPPSNNFALMLQDAMNKRRM